LARAFSRRNALCISREKDEAGAQIVRKTPKADCMAIALNRRSHKEKREKTGHLTTAPYSSGSPRILVRRRLPLEYGTGRSSDFGADSVCALHSDGLA
jgi:hypothetical protein